MGISRNKSGPYQNLMQPIFLMCCTFMNAEWRNPWNINRCDVKDIYTRIYSLAEARYHRFIRIYTDLFCDIRENLFQSVNYAKRGIGVVKHLKNPWKFVSICDTMRSEEWSVCLIPFKSIQLFFWFYCFLSKKDGVVYGGCSGGASLHS